MKNKALVSIQLIVIQLICFTILSFGQSKPKLIMCMTDLDTSDKQALKQMGCSFSTLVAFPDNTLTLVERDFRKHIARLFPDSAASGIGVLDWEGPAFSKLRSGDPNSDDYKTNMGYFISAIRIAKAMRPNIKWGYYGIPFINRDKGYQSWNAAVVRLIKECDILFPSLYQYYPSSSSSGNEKTYVTDNVTDGLRIAKMYNKPYMPFVWHRWYVTNKEKGLDLIPLPVFEARIKDISSVSVGGTKVDAIVWWGEDTYYYKQNNDHIIREIPRNASFKSYHKKLIVNYAKDISSKMKASN